MQNMTELKTKRPWQSVPLEEASGLQLPHPEIQGPINSMGQECPWPWDPQQLKGAPLGMYHCPYCGDMVMAGMDHVDYKDDPDVIAVVQQEIKDVTT
jgi:hypothetical protein